MFIEMLENDNEFKEEILFNLDLKNIIGNI